MQVNTFEANIYLAGDSTNKVNRDITIINVTAILVVLKVIAIFDTRF